jgi:predicted DsbA family dithiol-disulfide isomerase
MIIDVWSDVVCPWCFIGKKRLEKAIAKLPEGTPVEIRHRAFQLQPDIEGVTKTSDYLASKYRVDVDQVAAMQANVCSIADGEGLCYDLENTYSGNTFDAHRLVLWAAEKGKQAELLEAMYSAYFEKSEPLFSHDDLLKIVERVGLDVAGAREVLSSNAFAERVVDDQKVAASLGANGVPFFVFDMKVGFSGAQPLEVFEQAIAKALEAS